ncbi:MAG: aminotransferase class I/II-fold pyridoxal phosphate-dependent enzyme [Lysobacterales bacterium]
MKPQTLAVHAGSVIDGTSGAVAPSIELSTTFEHAADGTRGTAGLEYIREDNPNQRQLEAALCALEGGAAALVFASGMAATVALLDTIEGRGEIVLPLDVYHGVRRYCREVLVKRGFVLREVDYSDARRVEAVLGPATQIVWCETPSNPQLTIADIAAIAEAAHRHGALLAVDNTFATPLLQNPLALGADVVMHSTTKYLAGHSDALGGALVFARDDEFAQRVRQRRTLSGAIAAPFNTWLTLRGIRSLAPRMEFHCRNAAALAAFLEQHPAIARVNYPGLASHPGYAIAARQMRAFGGMLSVRCRGGREAALQIASRLRIFTNATSLGGVESLVEHRHSVESAGSTTPDDLLRVSVGVEHIDDLIADWQQALA